MNPEEKHICCVRKHVFDIIAEQGYFLSSENVAAPSACPASLERIAIGEKEKLWASFTVSRLSQFNAIDESVHASCVLILFWRVNSQALRLSDLSEKAQASGSNFRLNRLERNRFVAACPLPKVTIHHCRNLVFADDGELRMLNGHPECNYVSYRTSFSGVVHFQHQFKNFPFDVQLIPVKLIVASYDEWMRYELIIFSVHFFRPALLMAEWQHGVPNIKRSVPRDSSSYVLLRAKRHSGYYLQYVHVMVGLQIMALSSFLCDTSINGSAGRIIITVTLLLTMVAVKFSVSANLPSLQYNTLIDKYFYVSSVGIAVITFLTAVPQYFPSIPNPYGRRNMWNQASINLWMAAISLVYTLLGWGLWFIHSFQCEQNQGKFERVDVDSMDSYYVCYLYSMEVPFLRLNRVQSHAAFGDIAGRRTSPVNDLKPLSYVHDGSFESIEGLNASACFRALDVPDNKNEETKINMYADDASDVGVNEIVG